MIYRQPMSIMSTNRFAKHLRKLNISYRVLFFSRIKYKVTIMQYALSGSFLVDMQQQ